MSSKEEGSMSIRIRKGKEGDQVAINELIQRLQEDDQYRHLMKYCTAKLGDLGSSYDSAEAAMQEVLKDLYCRFRDGKMEKVDNRKRLFGLLRLRVAYFARDYRQKAAVRHLHRNRGGSVDASDDCQTLDLQFADPHAADDMQTIIFTELYTKIQEEIAAAAKTREQAELWKRILFEWLSGSRKSAEDFNLKQNELKNLQKIFVEIAKKVYPVDWLKLEDEFGKS